MLGTKVFPTQPNWLQLFHNKESATLTNILIFMAILIPTSRTTSPFQFMSNYHSKILSTYEPYDSADYISEASLELHSQS